MNSYVIWIHMSYEFICRIWTAYLWQHCLWTWCVSNFKSEHYEQSPAAACHATITRVWCNTYKHLHKHVQTSLWDNLVNISWGPIRCLALRKPALGLHVGAYFFFVDPLCSIFLSVYASIVLLLLCWTGVWRCDGHHDASHFEYCYIVSHAYGGVTRLMWRTPSRSVVVVV
jgi:hypothetical protein